MSNSIQNESVESELRQLLDELAVRSMSDLPVDAVERQAICERFAAISQVAAGAELGDLAQFGESLVKRLLNTGVPEFLSALRGAVSQMQEKLDAAPAAAATGEVKAEDGGEVDEGLIADFIVESREHLVTAEERALALEKEPGDAEAINALFRAFHSIKGLAAFLDFDRVYRFAHEVETLLDYARNHELEVTHEVIDHILAASDFLTRCLDAIAGPGLDSVPVTESALVARIRETIATEAHPLDGSKPAVPEIPEQPQPAAPVAVAPSAPSDSQPVALPEPAASREEKAIVISPAESRTPAQNPPAEGGVLAANNKNSERYSIRVETTKLDYLMDMVGELVIAESLVRTEIIDQADGNSSLIRSITQLAQITSEVQRTTFRMRMVPIGQLLRRTGRIVRDLARKFNKQVEIVFEGEETEVDKTIAEELADPLMHIVRNAIDHGIETAEQRAASGKNPVATIVLSASHEGSMIVVEVSDDGRGLDRQKILKRAMERNLVTDANIADSAVVELIFNPGFSTAEKVTTVSGRGVGMDVVRRHVEKLRGRVDVESKQGSGTKFTLKLPLTRAIIDGLVVKVGDTRYVIPMSSVREIFRPAESAVSTVQSKGELVMLHNRLLPILRLNREFRVESAIENPWEAVLIVIETEGRHICLMVDELVGKQEVVVKSLGQYLKDVPGVSGGTILGDGRVGLILDVQQIEVKE